MVMDSDPLVSSRQLWADAHAHPGRCFLCGLSAEDALVAALGPPDIDVALADLRAGGVSLASFATVADLRVLAIRGAGADRRNKRVPRSGKAQF